MSEMLMNVAVFVISSSCVLVAALAVYFVYNAAVKAGFILAKRFAITAFVMISLFGWLVVALDLSRGASLITNGRNAGFLTVFLPMILGTIVLFASKNLRLINRQMPAHWLIALQFYRVARAIFLFPFYAYDLLPAGFALPAGIGDILVGITAPFVALKVARKTNFWLATAVIWNIFGIIDLIVAPLSAILSGAQTIGQFPLVIIPLFLGPPLGTLLHIYSLVNLSSLEQQLKLMLIMM